MRNEMNIEINYYYPNENINNKVEFKIENLLKSLGFELKELYSSDINCGIYRKFEFEKEEGICKECGGKFLWVSKKPKYYCTSKCTSKAISRKRREKDPEGYRKQQREIMRKKYISVRKKNKE
jgi:hypothetical protein